MLSRTPRHTDDLRITSTEIAHWWLGERDRAASGQRRAANRTARCRGDRHPQPMWSLFFM